MTTFADMAARFRAFDIVAEGREAMQETGTILADYNRRRLLKGKGTDGQNLSPKYSEDPYFKGNRVRALAYANWKHRITPQADFDVPTFYINGYTHDRIRPVIQANSLSFEATVPWSGDIQAKTGGKAFGLSDDDVDDYRKTVLNAELAKRLAAATGAKIG